jgi:hypothetical protein
MTHHANPGTGASFVAVPAKIAGLTSNGKDFAEMIELRRRNY